MILGAIAEATEAGARLERCCDMVGIDPRTIQRWRSNPTGEDQRRGPKRAPRNRLSESERRAVLEVVTSPKYRDLTPNQRSPL
jgi:putative transposase